MTQKATLDHFATSATEEPNMLTLEERLLNPISPSVGLRLIPGQGDPLYLRNRDAERYLFRDDHGQWFTIQSSTKNSEDAFVRWVYPLDNKPKRLR